MMRNVQLKISIILMKGLYGWFCPCFMTCDVAYSLEEWSLIMNCCHGLPQMRSKLRYMTRIHV